MGEITVNQKNSYKVIKALNNNVIVALREADDQEIILIGKGIGFNQKSGRTVQIPMDKIEKTYCNFEGKFIQEYLRLIGSMDRKVIGVVEEFIHQAEQKLGHLDHHIHIALTDHIGFAIDRLKDNLVINNPFIYEIKAMYKKEYDLALQGRDLLYKRLKVQIPEDEVGFIALHLHAGREKKDVKYTLKDTRLLQELLTIIEDELGYGMDKELTKYSRLISHLKQTITRVENQKEIINPLLDEIKVKLDTSFLIANKVAQRIEKERGIHVSDDELGYLALHIERLRN